MDTPIVIEKRFSADQLSEAFDVFEEQVTDAIKNITESLKNLRLAFHSRRRLVNYYRHPCAR